MDHHKCLKRCRSLLSAASVVLVSALSVSTLAACDSYPKCGGGEECSGVAWSRLIVAIYSEYPGTEAMAYSGLGALGGGSENLCNEELLERGYAVCFRVWTDPDQKDLTLDVTVPDRETASMPVHLAKHNYCARNVGFVEASCEESGVRFSDVRYFSPCDGDRIPGSSFAPTN